MCCHIASLYVHFDKVDASLWQNIITTLPHWWIYGAVFKLQALGITCRTQLCLYQINSSIPSPPLTLGVKLLNAFNRYCWKNILITQFVVISISRAQLQNFTEWSATDLLWASIIIRLLFRKNFPESYKILSHTFIAFPLI